MCQTVVVTGGSRGLGAEICRSYVSEDRKVFSLSRSGDSPCEGVVGICCDVVSKKAIQKACGKTGPPDVLINNAAAVKDSPIYKMCTEDWDFVWETCFTGTVNMLEIYLPVMSCRGTVINIISSSAFYGRKGQCNYSAAKAALSSLAVSMGRELGKRGIRINNVNPGFMRTGMSFSEDDVYYKKAMSDSLLGTVSEVKAAAEFVKYAAGLPGVTGQTFNFDSRLF
ncbi:MAG: SDR family NAD(P)-dependent oxidoreductase [Fibrobacterota bacterium]